MDMGVSFDYEPQFDFGTQYQGDFGGNYGGEWDDLQNWNTGGMNVQDYGTSYQGDWGYPDQPRPDAGTGNSGVQMDAPYQSGPQVGQPSGSSEGASQDDWWKKTKGVMGRGYDATRSGLDKTADFLKPETSGTKMLAGLGMSLAPSLLGAAGKALQGQPKQPKSSYPASPGSGQAYTSPPLEPLPGTLASPLITKGPTQTKFSQGLEEQKKKQPYGGFSIY